MWGLLLRIRLQLDGLKKAVVNSLDYISLPSLASEVREVSRIADDFEAGIADCMRETKLPEGVLSQ